MAEDQGQGGAPPKAPPLKRPSRGRTAQMRSFMGLGLIVVIMAAVVVKGAASATDYYVTVPQVTQAESSYLGQNVRVQGALLTKTVSFDAATHRMTFRMGTGAETLLVQFTGAAPDDFGPGANAIVSGTEISPGVISARQVLVQCPDHYKAVPDTQVLTSLP